MRRAALAIAAAVCLVLPAFADDWRHAHSLVGEPRYPAGFSHFDYVNPQAPKGGVVRQGVPGSFDNLNPVVAEVKGNLVGVLKASMKR